jgi:hypothetical protein
MSSAVLSRARPGGRARTAVLEGIGRGRLLTEALEVAQRLGFRVLAGRCDELDGDRPLRALREALDVERGASDPQRAELARLLGVGAGSAGGLVSVAGTADEGWLIVEAVLEVLEGVAATAPLALAIEDLKWADPLTLRALHTIARDLTRLPWLVRPYLGVLLLSTWSGRLVSPLGTSPSRASQRSVARTWLTGEPRSTLPARRRATQ